MNRETLASGTRSAPRRGLSRREVLAGAAALVGGMVVTGCGSASISEGPAPTDTGAAGSPPAPDGDLNFWTYANYVAPAVLKGFESAYNVKVNYTYYDSQDEILTKIGAGQSYDVVVQTSTLIPLSIEGGILREIDHSVMSNWSDVLPFFQDPFYDPGAKHCVPHALGGAGIAWRTDKINGEITGDWPEFWDHPEADGHIYLWDSAATTIGMGLSVAGYAPDSTDPAEIDAAVQKLRALKPRLGGFTGDEATLLDSGQAWLTFGWAGDVFLALQNATNPPASSINYKAAVKHSFFNSDNLVIPSTVAHPGTAALFLDYMMDPANVAKNVGYIGYPIPTNAGMAAYEELTKEYPFLSEGLDAMTDQSQWAVPVDAERQKLYKSAFIEVKA